MHPFPRWQSNVCILLIALSLAACGGLPRQNKGTPSSAISDNHSRLAGMVKSHVAAHPDQSGIHALSDARDALAARLVLADTARSSIDVQYFIWNRDLSGKIMIERLLRAADRGVRVRLLLDDLGTMPSDEVLLTIDSHPNIEVRMFNPVTLRTPRLLGALIDFARINRRMHNKSFTVDGQISIVGGRNIGDEYFGAHDGANFDDLDVAVVGPVVKEVSSEFDLYWNHPAAVPITSLSSRKMKPDVMAGKRAALIAHHEATRNSIYADSVKESEFARQIRNRNLSFYWGHATIVNDHPDKVITSSSKTETHLAPQLLGAVNQTKRELFLVSPYLVPGKQGVKLLKAARERGARVVILTNSLASTDALAVHSKYQLYRKPLLRAGVEIYEMKPTSGGHQGMRSGGFFAASKPGKSGGASLHAKTFSFDRRIGFVGSYNIDPRSSRLNTEMGVLFDSPELTKRMPETIERNLGRNAYRLELVGNHIEWVAHEDGKEERHTSEPEVIPAKRIKVGILRWLPIEGLL